MDVVLYVIATTDPNLAQRAQAQALVRRDRALKMFLEIDAETTIEQMCRRIADRFTIGSSWRLAELHICAHGNAAYGFVDIGTQLRAMQAPAFRAIRRCWINTGTVAPGAHLEMNVCDAAGVGMTPTMITLADSGGVPVRACPVPIPLDTLFAPPEGFEVFMPRSGGITQADYLGPETALQGGP
jgi:hypothetical protein